jgi:hypothetical protein
MGSPLGYFGACAVIHLAPGLLGDNSRSQPHAKLRRCGEEFLTLRQPRGYIIPPILRWMPLNRTEGIRARARLFAGNGGRRASIFLAGREERRVFDGPNEPRTNELPNGRIVERLCLNA